MNIPRFSVVIPTFNRPVQLTRALAALARSEHPRNAFEVIVVDDGGSEPLEWAVTAFRSGMDVRLVRQSRKGPAAARNRGSELSNYEFLAFTDDDCEPAAGWLPHFARSLQRSPESLAGGQTVNGLTKNIYSTASQFILEMAYAYYNSNPIQPRFFAAHNLAMRADLFRKLGGFDEDFRASEDRELCNRWQHRGLALLYEPGAVVEHRHPLTLWSFCQQHFNYGRGAAHFHSICASRNSGRFRDHLGFYAEMPRWWQAAGDHGRNLPVGRLLPLLGLWQIANAAGFVSEAFTRGSNGSHDARENNL